MTNKERFIKLMSGEKPDITPLLIFSELLPNDVYNKELRQLDIGLIMHTGSVFPVSDADTDEKHKDGIRRYTVSTPFGEIYSEYFTGHEKISGSGEIQKSYFIKGPEDYKRVIWMLDHTDFEIDSKGYYRTLEILGEDGVTHTWCDEPPYMALQYLMGYEKWCLDQYDYEDLFFELMEAYDRMQTRRMEAQLKAPERDLICIGNLSGNYSPEKYREHTKPYFDKWGRALNEIGCSVTIHADALNLSRHIDVFPSDGVRVAEAFTPPPVGDLGLREARQAWGDDIVFHINIPESIFYLGYDYAYNWTKELLASDSNPRRFLSFTENGLLGVAGKDYEMYLSGLKAVNDAIHS